MLGIGFPLCAFYPNRRWRQQIDGCSNLSLHTSKIYFRRLAAFFIRFIYICNILSILSRRVSVGWDCNTAWVLGA